MFNRTKVNIKQNKLLNKVNLIIFAVLFACIGTYLVINSRAAVGVGLNTASANIFISASGSDTGSNCKRYSNAMATPPTANSVCATAARAYELMSNGDTAWILPGSYGTAHAWDFEVNAPSTFKPSTGSDCNSASSKSCFYFIPQPGKELNVSAGNLLTNDDNGPGFKPNKAPDNLYYANFVGPRMCPSFSSTADSITGFHQDITVANFKGTDCTPYISGPWGNIRIIGADIAYNCDTEGTAGGWQIQSNQNPNGLGGEATDHRYAPHDLLIANNKIHDFTINGCGPANPHEDCIHVYAWYNATVENNTFDNCYDSSILVGGLDEPGFNENVVIQNNWFGPTILGVNNCCLRGDTNPSSETFDGYIIRFNTSTSTFMNKTGNVLNNVSFIGNIGMGDNVCRTGSNLVWKYNLYRSPSAKCDPTDTAGVSNTLVKLKNLNNSSLDLRIQTGSIADGYVPTSFLNGCNAVSGGKDIFGNLRATTGNCDAGAYELFNITSNAEKANLWIDQNGGNCVRSDTPIEYAGAGDTNSCSSSDSNPTQGSFNSAYKVAKPADLVLIRQGIYTTQEIDYKAGAASPNITIQAETGASVKVKELDIQSASYVTFKNFTVIPAKPDAKPDGSGGEAPYNQILDFGTETGQTTGAHHVTLDGVNVDGRQPDGTPSNRDASGINGNTAYITIKNADFGFIRGRKVMIIQNYGAKGPNDHLELDNVKLHDDPQWPDGGNHLECLWLSSTTNSLFNRLHLYNCALPMILSTFGDDLPARTTTIQNSIFEASQGYGGNPGYFSIDGCLGRPSAGLYGSLTLKYNYFSIPFGCADGTASSGLKLVGNIGSANSCLSGASYSHNIWSGAKCGNTDVLNSTITNSANYMKLANPFVNQPGDYRPSSGNSPQVNSGDPTVYSANDWRAYPATDASGNIRPIGGISDVGPFEYTGTTTPPPTPTLPGDVDGNKVVDIDDLSLLLINWKKNYPQADFVKDNIIDIDDLSILLINWGKKQP